MANVHLAIHEGLTLNLSRSVGPAGTVQLHACGKTPVFASFQRSDLRMQIGVAARLWIDTVAFDLPREQLAKAAAFLDPELTDGLTSILQGENA